MPERAKVFVAEDNSFSLFLAKQSLADDHHTVVLEAQTLAKALKCIAQFKEQNIQVAVLDGNLTENASSGYDGKRKGAQE